MRELTKMIGDYILKRLTELIERLSGFGLRGRSPVPSVMQKAAIEARDQDAGACSRSLLSNLNRCGLRLRVCCLLFQTDGRHGSTPRSPAGTCWPTFSSWTTASRSSSLGSSSRSSVALRTLLC